MSKDTEIHRVFEQLSEELYLKGNLLPAKFTFILTNRCNLSCPFCFMKRKTLDYAMTTEDWLDIANQVPEYARVSITGGEPLLFEGFEKVFRHVAERNVCNVSTNGLLLNETNMEMMASFHNFKLLSISIDDIGNKNRCMQQGDWDLLKNNIITFAKFKKKSCALDIKTTILDGNADDLFQIHKYCYDVLGCDTHAFQFLKGTPLLHSDIVFDFNDVFVKYRAPTYRKWDVILEQLEKVRSWSVEHGKKAFILPKVADLNSEVPLNNFDFINSEDLDADQHRPCMHPWSSVQINSDGNVIPCLAVSMGNVREKPFNEIFFGDQYEKFKKLVREKGTVQGCNRCCWLPLRLARQSTYRKYHD